MNMQFENAPKTMLALVKLYIKKTRIILNGAVHKTFICLCLRLMEYLTFKTVLQVQCFQ